MAAADDFCVGGLGFFEAGEMSLRNNEHVGGRLRPDVFEGEHVFIFVNLFSGNLAANHAAEQAIRVCHCYLPGGNDNTAAQTLSASLWKSQRAQRYFVTRSDR